MSQIPVARLKNSEITCALRIRCDPKLWGAHIGSHVISSGILTTARETTVEQDLFRREAGIRELLFAQTKH